ncbi:flagellar filament outer layer protein FlaA [Thermospira aquatica]|uniref:Flagellar filament outer layer protein FlaA n=1 Tax=Thermospira aquatica TaxID=2828656 RepID=A0AAX3BDY5_9SPIR|nr:flagellar filament outer layer protein FlaA [Thermospira aquatica]URA10487.1 hypothetical protein KDW03_01410 [Thermospira aquatica]
MRRELIVSFLLVSALSAYGVISRNVIDFSEYDQRIKLQFEGPEESYITNIDGQPRIVFGYKDFLLESWTVKLNESANLDQNRFQSYCKPVESKRFGTVIGARIHFPTWKNNANALLQPPFPIKIYDDEGRYMNISNGVMPNVSEVRSVSMWISGRNYPYGASVRFRDKNEEYKEFFVGWLNFEGWRKLMYVNPNFSERFNAKILRREPLYPKDVPYLVLDAIIIYRYADQIGGDFVTYIKSIDMEYTPYVVDSDVVEDINDEEVWQIITTRAKRRQKLEEMRLVEDLYLYQQEKYRMQLNKDPIVDK